ncbi:MAG: SGNH/GDSL hydrolase family protein [Myxococcota bacterium]
MTTTERDLERQLLDDDDERVYAALRRFFRPVPRMLAPLLYDWIPQADLSVVLGDGEGGGLLEAASRRMIDLANATDAALRKRRFERKRRTQPDWPVVVVEGDSWVSHPFVDDLGDHLFDDDLNSFHVLNRGAAGDRLVTVLEEREHEAVLDQVEPVAMVLSGGGNDLLVQFDEFLRSPPDPSNCEPERLVAPAFEERVQALMGVMRRLLLGVRAKDATLPILVHGYDYLRVLPRGKGQFLTPHFDRAGIDGELRQATLDTIIDRYNEVLEAVAVIVPGVTYVDLRGTVPEDEWHDEIHPNDVGFRRLADVMGEVVRDRMRPPKG